MNENVIEKSASFSDCRAYRYELWRWWDKSKGYAMFIGLNPSTADETEDDPTIRRCIRFARDWGYGGLLMTNIFAFRATDPDVMKAAADPVGPSNDIVLLASAAKAGIVIAAWGVDGIHMGRAAGVPRGIVAKLHCLGYSKDGHPRHPLYMKADSKPIPYPRTSP